VDILSQLQPSTHVYDRRAGQERVVHQVERRGRVISLSFKRLQTGAVDRQPFSADEVKSRFEVLSTRTTAFRAPPEIVRLVAEAHRLEHAYLFNPLFATETWTFCTG